MLELDLTEPPLTAPPGDPWRPACASSAHVRTDVSTVWPGAFDPRVVGVVAKLGAPMALATAQEVRDAVQAFRRSGKPTLAWAETFGEFEPGTVAYYLATAFERIWLGPSGDVVLAGVRVDALFLRRALDTVGVEAQMGAGRVQERLQRPDRNRVHRRAPGGDSRTGLVGPTSSSTASPAGRGSTLSGPGSCSGPEPYPVWTRWTLDWWTAWGTATRCSMSCVGGSGVSSSCATSAATAGHGPKEVRRVTDKATGRGRSAVALVHAHGVVRLGRSRRSPLSGTSFGSDTVSAALRAAARPAGSSGRAAG